jgi:hypothetical protein
MMTPQGASHWRAPNSSRSAAGMSRPRALNLPRAARVRAHGSSPYEINGERVEAVRESWLVEDRWWTENPLRRRYWELVSVRGRNLVVYHDLFAGGWFTQGS